MNTLFSNMVVALAALASVTAIEIPVNLGTAENYAILSKAGISTVPDSVITGDIAVSPIAETAMTGFSLMKGTDGTKATSTQVTGLAYAASFLGDTPTVLTTAVGDMETAYADAAGRTNADAARINLGAGILGGEFGGPTKPLTAGVYTFDTDVGIKNDITFDGTADDMDNIFIIQVAGNVLMDANYRVNLTGNALAKNIFWQVAGSFEVSAGSHMEGTILCATGVTFITESSLNGRILAQTAAVLQKATITEK